MPLRQDGDEGLPPLSIRVVSVSRRTWIEAKCVGTLRGRLGPSRGTRSWPISYGSAIKSLADIELRTTQTTLAGRFWPTRGPTPSLWR
jgi:hypothetical protein